MPIGFDNPYLGLAAGYFANRRPGVSSLASLGGGFQDVMQQQIIKKQQEREQKRFEQQQERADIQNKALLKQIKRQETQDKTNEALGELAADGLSPKNKALVESMIKAGHIAPALSLVQRLTAAPKPASPLTKSELEAQLAQKIGGGDPLKTLAALRGPSESNVGFGKSGPGWARNNIIGLLSKTDRKEPLTPEDKRVYEESRNILTTEQWMTGPSGEKIRYIPGTTFPELNNVLGMSQPVPEGVGQLPGEGSQAIAPAGGAAQAVAQNADPGVTKLQGGGTLETVIEGREPREPAPVIKAREAITTAQTGIEEVQTILDFLAGTSAPVTGLGGFAQRNFAEGIFPSVQEAAGGKVDIETPATDFQLMVDNLKTQNRVALTGGGNTSVAEWERIDKMIQGLDWKASRAQTEASLRAIQKNMEAVINKNRVFAESMGVDVAEPLGPYQPNPDLTPEQNAIMEAYHLDKMSIEEAKAAMRATGVED